MWDTYTRPALTTTTTRRRKKEKEGKRKAAGKRATPFLFFRGAGTPNPHRHGENFFPIYIAQHGRRAPQKGGPKKTGQRFFCRKGKRDMSTREEIRTAKETLNKYVMERYRKIAYNNPYLIAYRLADYIYTYREQDKPLTETGLAVALNLDNNIMQRYLNGERDYQKVLQKDCRESKAEINLALEKFRSREELKEMYMYLSENEDKDLLLSTPIKKARMLVALEREERLAKSGKVGDIFTMKAREGWQDTTERHEHVLKIKSDNALAALAQLGFSKDGTAL